MFDEMTLGKASKFAIFYKFKNPKLLFSLRAEWKEIREFIKGRGGKSST